MQTFKAWVRNRKPVVMPEVDRLWQIIINSGRKGISRCNLGAAIDLEPDTLNNVIQALADIGKLSVSMEAGERIYRPA